MDASAWPPRSNAKSTKKWLGEASWGLEFIRFSSRILTKPSLQSIRKHIYCDAQKQFLVRTYL